MGGIEQAPWVRVRCDLARHPRVEGLTHKARWLYVVGLLEAGETRSDGELRPARLRAVLLEAGCTRRHAVELVAAGLWVELDGGGVTIRDYLEHQRSRTEIERDREANRERAARYRARRSEPAPGIDAGVEPPRNGVTNGERTSVVTPSRSRKRSTGVRGTTTPEPPRPRRACPDCGATMPPGVVLEDHRRMTHGVEP